MKRLMISLMLALGIGSVATSLSSHHGQILDWDQLNLTTQQGQQVESIRNNYRDEFQILRKFALDKLEKKQRMLDLRQKMIADIQQVLSPEQNEQANTMMIKQLEKRINKRLDLLALKLELSSEQQAKVQSLLTTNLVRDKDELYVGRHIKMNQRQYMFDRVDEYMPNILSSVQLEQWQALKNKQAS